MKEEDFENTKPTFDELIEGCPWATLYRAEELGIIPHQRKDGVWTNGNRDDLAVGLLLAMAETMPLAEVWNYAEKSLEKYTIELEDNFWGRTTVLKSEFQKEKEEMIRGMYAAIKAKEG